MSKNHHKNSLLNSYKHSLAMADHASKLLLHTEAKANVF